jgi:hypothetical protein
MEATVQDKAQLVCRLLGLHLACWFRVRANLWRHGFEDFGHLVVTDPGLTDLWLSVRQFYDQRSTEPTAIEPTGKGLDVPSVAPQSLLTLSVPVVCRATLRQGGCPAPLGR